MTRQGPRLIVPGARRVLVARRATGSQPRLLTICSRLAAGARGRSGPRCGALDVVDWALVVALVNRRPGFRGVSGHPGADRDRGAGPELSPSAAATYVCLS